MTVLAIIAILAIIGAAQVALWLVDLSMWLSQRAADRRRRQPQLPLMLQLHPYPADRNHQLRRLVRMR